MPNAFTRRELPALAGVALAGAAVLAADPPVVKEPERDYPAPKFVPSFKKPKTGTLLVQDFVIYAHDNLDMVKTLLAKDATLANAAVDWGAGDWETGLGGASHLGRRDIAEYLIEHGARIDLFAAAMLGYLDAIKLYLTKQPKLITARGPHGFSLHWHAKMGKDAAAETLKFLESVGPDPMPPLKKKAP